MKANSYRIVANREGSPLRPGDGRTEFTKGDLLGTLELDPRIELGQLVNGLATGVIIAELATGAETNRKKGKAETP